MKTLGERADNPLWQEQSDRDEEAPREHKLEGLLSWRRQLDAVYGAGAEELHPVSTKLREALQRFAIRREDMEAVIDGCAMDVEKSRYATWEELYTYCYRVASVVGLICLRIFGDEEERGKAYAENLGVALQLTNILRDLGSDLKRGRIYLPGEELHAFGYPEEALARRERSEAFVKLMRFQVERARGFFAAAEREAATLDPRRILAAEIMGRIYRRLLARIEASGFDVFSREVRVPFHERAWIAGSSILAAHTAR